MREVETANEVEPHGQSARRPVMVRLTEEEYAALLAAARMDDRAMGYVARNFIRTGLGLAGTAPKRGAP